MPDRRLMTVEGYTLPAEIEDVVVERMRAESIYGREHVVCWTEDAIGDATIVRSGVVPSYRLADRLLQRERKAGRIVYRKGAWHRVEEEAHAG